MKTKNSKYKKYYYCDGGTNDFKAPFHFSATIENIRTSERAIIENILSKEDNMFIAFENKILSDFIFVYEHVDNGNYEKIEQTIKRVGKQKLNKNFISCLKSFVEFLLEQEPQNKYYNMVALLISDI